ncbi:MAG: threo-3-hydroxy-L-aspartate ammonia-lyase [Candidatus Eremiobacteraeota bacterium]|nr:threo-3-hydroxy-L-aspartate ammonia-lyase [Candidatus Eremiobacteraeota bacterium]
MATVLPSVTFEDVLAAASRLQGIAHRTPVVTSRTLDERTGSSAFLKCENFQRMGAFKFRGAYNRLVQLDTGARARGVVAFSSGNHAQGVALAAQLLGIEATIVMPKDAPRTKLEATRGYGATVVLYDRAEEDRAVIAQQICDERGATMVPPYDDVHIVAGQGTSVLELLQDVADIGVVLVPTGGAGLLSGTAVAAHAINPRIAVYGVEPEKGNDVEQSLAAGERIKIPVPDTIADGMMTQSPGEITFPLVQRYARGVVTVSDAEIVTAMRFAFERLKLVLEPSGAASLAALLFGKVQTRGKRVGVILSGGNVDAHTFANLIAG